MRTANKIIITNPKMMIVVILAFWTGVLRWICYHIVHQSILFLTYPCQNYQFLQIINLYCYTITQGKQSQLIFRRLG